MSDLPNCPVCGGHVRESKFDDDGDIDCIRCNGDDVNWGPHIFAIFDNEYRALCALVEAGRTATEKIAYKGTLLETANTTISGLQEERNQYQEQASAAEKRCAELEKAATAVVGYWRLNRICHKGPSDGDPPAQDALCDLAKAVDALAGKEPTDETQTADLGGDDAEA
ncbi:MAG: hypothetical protein ABIH23_18960 [bacterium]